MLFIKNFQWKCSLEIIENWNHQRSSEVYSILGSGTNTIGQFELPSTICQALRRLANERLAQSLKKRGHSSDWPLAKPYGRTVWIFKTIAIEPIVPQCKKFKPKSSSLELRRAFRGSSLMLWQHTQAKKRRNLRSYRFQHFYYSRNCFGATADHLREQLVFGLVPLLPFEFSLQAALSFRLHWNF